jgi:PST family polysaccharide transporter
VSGTSVGTDPAPLGRQAARGGAVTMGGQLLKVGVQAVSIVVLARLLDPEAFGYLAMVLALVGVAETVRDFGRPTPPSRRRPSRGPNGTTCSG